MLYHCWRSRARGHATPSTGPARPRPSARDISATAAVEVPRRGGSIKVIITIMKIVILITIALSLIVLILIRLNTVIK